MIAKNDRHLRIEVGYGLEGALTDATTKRIIDEDITPKFKSGDFAGGVSAGINKMIRVIDGEKLPAPEPPHWQQQTGLFDVDAMFNPFLLIPVFLFGGLMRTMLGRLVGAGVSGGVVTLIAWFLFGSLAAAIFAGLIAFVLCAVQRRHHVGRRGAVEAAVGPAAAAAAHGPEAVRAAARAIAAAGAAVSVAAARRGAGR